jgi:hypothetical protein
MIIEAIKTHFAKCPCVRRGRQEVGHPATRVNASAPEFASNIYIILFIYIYKREYFRGCVFFRIQADTFLQAGFSSVENWHILVTRLAQHQYPRGLRGSLKVVCPLVAMDIRLN